MSERRDIIKSLVSNAVLGTGRAGARQIEADGALGAALDSTSSQDPEDKFLNMLALVTQYNRAGKVQPQIKPVTLEPAKSESAPVISARAADLLKQSLEGKYEAAFPEVVKLMAARGRRAPFPLLPNILHAGSRHKHIRDLIVSIIGERGLWLAKQNKDWEYAANLQNDNDVVTVQGYLQIWSELTIAERKILLAEVRRTNPPLGAELVMSTWADENKSGRLELLKLLQKELRDSDTLLLELALTDRSVEVRRTARDLLARLPGSSVASYALSVATRFLLIRRTMQGLDIALDLPQIYEPEWLHFGIEEKSWIKDIGDRSWWIIQWIGLTPPEYWSGLVRKSASSLLDAVGKSEWADALCVAFTKGAANSNDVNWKYELVKHWAVARDKRPTLSTIFLDINELGSRAEGLIFELLDDYPEPLYDQHPAFSSIWYLRSDWTIPLARRIIKSCQQRCALDPTSDRSYWQTIQLVKKAAFHCPPVLVDELASNWPDQKDGWRQWKQTVDDFVDFLIFRRDLHKEFQQ